MHNYTKKLLRHVKKVSVIPAQYTKEGKDLFVLAIQTKEDFRSMGETCKKCREFFKNEGLNCIAIPYDFDRKEITVKALSVAELKESLSKLFNLEVLGVENGESK